MVRWVGRALGVGAGLSLEMNQKVILRVPRIYLMLPRWFLETPGWLW